MTFDDAAMARIRRGYLPMVMERKWFAWYEAQVLHLHCGWPGWGICQVRFRKEAAGWRAVSATVNRDPRHFCKTDDDSDRRMIAEVIEMFMVSGPAVPPTDPLLALLTQAAKTTYLGSPKVVSDPIQQILPASVAYVRQEAASPPSGV